MVACKVLHPSCHLYGNERHVCGVEDACVTTILPSPTHIRRVDVGGMGGKELVKVAVKHVLKKHTHRVIWEIEIVARLEEFTERDKIIKSLVRFYPN